MQTSKPVSPQQERAAKAVDRLFDLLPPQDVGDPKAFLAAMIALFAEYPPEVFEQAVFVIAQRSDRPTLKLARTVLVELYEPVARRLTREAIESAPRQLPRPPRTEEEQAKIDEQVNAARRRFGLSELPKTDGAA